MNLRDHKEWDRINGTLSVSQEPDIDQDERFVVLNGSTGNFCLDYSKGKTSTDSAIQRAWSSDTGYYVKILHNNVQLTRWWDGYTEKIPNSQVENYPNHFYQALTKDIARPGGSIIAFARETFLKLRNCILLSDNGQASLRTFMYLLAALEKGVETPKDVDKKYWNLEEFNANWISSHDWEMLYEDFTKGTYSSNGTQIKPLVKLVLRHASNRLFQEAHREATRKEFQLALFGETKRNYDSGVSEGAFYTPTPLVRTIVQEALWALDRIIPLTQRKSVRILDPACGSAEFLRETLRQLKMLNYTGQITIQGWDISEIACEMARFVLSYESRTEWNGKVKIDISNRDSLQYNWSEEKSFDIVLMNPPFNSFENLGPLKELVNKKLQGFNTRQPDMAAVFWKNAAEVVHNEGVLGLVLPHSFLSASSYKDLRRYISTDLKMNFSLKGKLGSAGLFEKAMIIPSILIGTKEKSAGVKTLLWTDYQQKSVYEAFRELRKYRIPAIPTPNFKPSFSIYEEEYMGNDTNDSESWQIQSYQMFQLAKKLREFETVGRLFDVKRGADAGNNKAFLLNKENWSKLPKSEKKYFHPCIMRDSMVQGKLNDNWFLFYPYKNNEISSEDELDKKLNKFYTKYLLPCKSKLMLRRGKNEKWWELNEPRVEWQLNGKPKLISAYFGKSGYFAIDRGNYLVGQSFAWLPKKEKLADEKYCLAYLGLLNAPLIDSLIEMVSVNIAGGQFDLSKHYIDKMPLPDLSKLDLHTLDKLSKIGKDIDEGKPIDRNDLNQLVANIYGLNLENFN